MKPDRTSFPLRLPKSVKVAAERFAMMEGASLNHFVTLAVAEKISALRAADFFARRSGEIDWAAFDRLMRREGGEPPGEGDSLPAGVKRGRASRRA